MREGFLAKRNLGLNFNFSGHLRLDTGKEHAQYFNLELGLIQANIRHHILQI